MTPSISRPPEAAFAGKELAFVDLAVRRSMYWQSLDSPVNSPEARVKKSARRRNDEIYGYGKGKQG
jgi:hypothetical protein